MEWVTKNFELWHTARNMKFGDQCPECWLKDKENLCGGLCRFIAEFLAGLQWKICKANPKESINIFIDATFKVTVYPLN